MHCLANYLAFHMELKTTLTEITGGRWARKFVEGSRPMLNESEEKMIREKCERVVIRKNAMKKYGIGGMLSHSYGNMLVDKTATGELSECMDQYINIQIKLNENMTEV